MNIRPADFEKCWSNISLIDDEVVAEGNVIFEQTLGLPSVSTISILREANERGIGIATITRDNADIVDKLDIDVTAKSEIAHAVKNGKTVIVPESDICFYEWKGCGYIIIDPETCAGAYMISGSICGGTTGIFSISVGMINIIWAMIDLCGIVTALMVATNPVVIVGLSVLYLMSFIALMSSVYDLLAYCKTNDNKYMGSMVFDLALNLTITAALEGIKVLVKTHEELAEVVIKNLDEVNAGTGSGTAGEIGETINNLPDYWKWVSDTYGMDVAVAIAEHGDIGKNMLNQYGDSFAGAVSKMQGADDVIRLVTEYPESADDVLTAITKYGDEAVKLIDSYGDEAIEQFRAGKSLDEVKGVLEGGLKFGMSFDDASSYLKSLDLEKLNVKSLNHYLKVTQNIGLSNKEVASLQTQILKDCGFTNFDIRGNLADITAFKQGTLQIEEFTDEVKLYRRGYPTEGVGEYSYGQWWSDVKMTIEDARDKLAILENWGNPLTGEYEMVVPKGTRSITGIAEEQFFYDDITGELIEYREGGAKQYWFNKIDSSWVQ